MKAHWLPKRSLIEATTPSIPVLGMLTLAALLSGCASTQMALRDLDGDMPPPLVQQYQASPKTEIDKGESFFLPLLSSTKSHLTKTAFGFDASRTERLVLGLIAKKKEEGRYSETGALLEYVYDADILTGLIHAEHSSRTKQDNSYRYAHKWSTLWDLIHRKNEWMQPGATNSPDSNP